jgi:acyl phosphate:glycerol-3-phosphate acyltransferase
LLSRAIYDGSVFVAIVMVVVGYVVAMIPTAQLVGRLTGRDPTVEGSRNPGASNVYRLSGKRAGAVVLFVDALKGAIPTAVALWVSGRPAAYATWVGAIAGHVWPVLRRFRGGKGVATASGGGFVMDPGIAALSLLGFLVVVKATRVVALGSLAIAVAYPALAAATGREGWEIAVGALSGLIILVRHAGNIRRLVTGKETRVGRPAPS